MFFPWSTTYRHSAFDPRVCLLLQPVDFFGNRDLGLSIFVFQAQGLALKGNSGHTNGSVTAGGVLRLLCERRMICLPGAEEGLLVPPAALQREQNRGELACAFGHPGHSRVCGLQERGCCANPGMAETHFQLRRSLSALFSQVGKLLRNIEELSSFCPWQL